MVSIHKKISLKKTIIICVLSCVSALVTPNIAFSRTPEGETYHISLTRTKTDSVQGPRVRTYELWVAPQKIFVKTKYTSGILRFDLNKEWELPSGEQTYKEHTLVNTNEEDEDSKSNVMYDYGFYYRPVYTWEVIDAKDKLKIDKWQCSHYILHGDAECSERTIDLWITDELPEYLSITNNENYYRIVYNDDYMKGLREIFPLLEKGVVILSKETFSNYYGPEVKIETKITICEIERENNVSFALPPDRLRTK